MTTINATPTALGPIPTVLTPATFAQWDHWAFVSTTIHLVHAWGAADALERLRPIVRDRGVPGRDGEGPHETLLVFYVWAADRLLAAGLSTTETLWHPLVDSRSPMAWYTEAMLDSHEARQHFVASDRALLREPAPHPPITSG